MSKMEPGTRLKLYHFKKMTGWLNYIVLFGGEWPRETVNILATCMAAKSIDVSYDERPGWANRLTFPVGHWSEQQSTPRYTLANLVQVFLRPVAQLEHVRIGEQHRSAMRCIR
jgi:hypothetical protein